MDIYHKNSDKIIVKSLIAHYRTSSFPDNNVLSMNYLFSSFTTLEENESKVSIDMVVNDFYSWNALTETDKIFAVSALKQYLEHNRYDLKSDIPKAVDLSEYAKLTTLEDYALKDDIPTFPDNLVNNDSLAATLSEYAKLTNIDECKQDLNTSLVAYRKKEDFAIRGKLPIERKHFAFEEDYVD